VAAIVGAVGLAVCASSGGGNSEGATAIKERQALMQTILKHWKLIKANAKAGGSAATVAKHAKALNATSKQMLALFPKGSGRGDFSDKQPRALPAVWKD
jgi:cytochrome c556